jgi:hypothetical protein
VCATGSWEPGFAEYVGAQLPTGARVVVGGAHVRLSAFSLTTRVPTLPRSSPSSLTL